MKISNKFLFILLTLCFFHLNGMSEEGISHENESKAEAKPKVEQTTESLQQYSLKAQCALKILGLIKSKEMKWGILVNLPEGLARYVELFHIADSYIDDYNVKADKQDQSAELSKLILESKTLIYRLIDSESEHLETFILALDDFFDFYTSEGKVVYKITSMSFIMDVFKIINLVLNKILDTTKVGVIISNHNATDLKIKSNKADDFFIQYCAKNAVTCNFVLIMKLLLDLNLLSRDYLLIMFEVACISHSSAQMLRLLNDKIGLTKNEFEDMLQNDDDIFKGSINGHLDIVEYIVELIEYFKLDLAEIINKRYEDSYNETLLICATQLGYLDIVRFLIAKGADVNIMDEERQTALSYARSNYLNFDRNGVFDHGSEERNGQYIADQLSEMLAIIKALKKARKKND